MRPTIGTRFAHCAGVNRDTVRLAGVTALVGVVLVAFVFGPYPVAQGLYRAGLWPRLTPDEVSEQDTSLTRCSEGVNGWDYICERPADPKRYLAEAKIGVMGSVFGIGWSTELPPGPVPDRSAFEAESRARHPEPRSYDISGWLAKGITLLLLWRLFR